MRELVAPEPINVTFPEPDAEGSTQIWSMQTALFRRNTYLSEALRMAYERSGQDLSVVSAGCSIGAEADSILALHRAEGYEGELSIRGYDLNRLAIEMAKEGAYKVLAMWQLSDLTQEALQALGFATSYAGLEDNAMGEPRHRIDVDAAPLRAEYDVGFAEHDLTKRLPSEGVDLVLANNVLHKIPIDSIRTVIRNLCGALTESGLLSVDTVSLNELDPRTQGAMEVLEEEFGMVPLMVSQSNPVILGRE